MLEGRKALITGGASGIGLATARRFIGEGANVVIIDINDAAGKDAAASIGATFVHADVSDSDQVRDAFRQASEALGGLDIACLNAGVMTGQRNFAELTDEQYFRIVNINLNGVVFGVREAVRAMTPRGGSILAMASIAGLIPWGADPVYALTKHGVVGLVRSLGMTLPKRGIRINAICPGITKTPLILEQTIEWLNQANIPLVPIEHIVDTCVRAIIDGDSGRCWTIQPGRKLAKY